VCKSLDKGHNTHERVLISMRATEALRLFPPLILLLREAKAPFSVTTSAGCTHLIPKARAAGRIRPHACAGSSCAMLSSAASVHLPAQGGLVLRSAVLAACPQSSCS
jgi:hypothetical protein